MSPLPKSSDRGILSDLQSFTFQKNGKNRCYLQVRGTGKDEFAQQLIDAIQQKITQKAASLEEEENNEKYIEQLDESIRMIKKHYVEGHARPEKMAGLKASNENDSNEKAIDLLQNWLRDDDSPLFALLGSVRHGQNLYLQNLCKKTN